MSLKPKHKDVLQKPNWSRCHVIHRHRFQQDFETSGIPSYKFCATLNTTSSERWYVPHQVYVHELMILKSRCIGPKPMLPD